MGMNRQSQIPPVMLQTNAMFGLNNIQKGSLCLALFHDDDKVGLLI